MRNRLRSLLNDLSGRSDRVLVDALIAQIDNAGRAIAVVLEAVRGEDLSAVFEQLVEVEDHGDTLRDELIDLLARTLSAPIDREDLFRLSRSVDDVLDDLRDFARELHLYGTGDASRYAPLLEVLEQGIPELAHAVEQLVSDPPQVVQSARAAKKWSSAVRKRYQEQVAELLAGPVDAEMLRNRELLRRLDVVGLRLGTATDALADGSLKRTH